MEVNITAMIRKTNMLRDETCLKPDEQNSFLEENAKLVQYIANKGFEIASKYTINPAVVFGAVGGFCEEINNDLDKYRLNIIQEAVEKLEAFAKEHDENGGILQ